MDNEMSGINEHQKPTTELYRLNYLIALDSTATEAERRKAKLRVNEIRGFEFYKNETYSRSNIKPKTKSKVKT